MATDIGKIVQAWRRGDITTQEMIAKTEALFNGTQLSLFGEVESVTD